MVGDNHTWLANRSVRCWVVVVVVGGGRGGIKVWPLAAVSPPTGPEWRELGKGSRL